MIKVLVGAILITFLTWLDQWTKMIAVKALKEGPLVLIPDVFEFYFLKNQGAAWGILHGQRELFVLITIVVMGVIGVYYLCTPNTFKYLPLNLCEILLFSGALGNMMDRIMLGYVRDFIYFKLIDFPVFNVADVFVVVSAILLCILVVFVYKDEDLEMLSFKKKAKEQE